MQLCSTDEVAVVYDGFYNLFLPVQSVYVSGAVPYFISPFHVGVFGLSAKRRVVSCLSSGLAQGQETSFPQASLLQDVPPPSIPP